MIDNEKARAAGGTAERAAESAAGSTSFPMSHRSTAAGGGQAIFDLLPIGEAHAISTAQLVKLTGSSSARELQERIAAEREAGALILSRASGGYFRPTSGIDGKREIERYIATLRARALNTLRILRAAKVALGEDPEQVTLDDLEVMQYTFDDLARSMRGETQLDGLELAKWTETSRAIKEYKKIVGDVEAEKAWKQENEALMRSLSKTVAEYEKAGTNVGLRWTDLKAAIDSIFYPTQNAKVSSL